LYERALKYIPNCYKLWFNYLKESLENLRSVRSYLGNQFAEVTQLFERSLVYMHKVTTHPYRKMPNIWMLYTEFLAS
jgi:pre-mRNA-splicing factor SYF1